MTGVWGGGLECGGLGRWVGIWGFGEVGWNMGVWGDLVESICSGVWAVGRLEDGGGGKGACVCSQVSISGCLTLGILGVLGTIIMFEDLVGLRGI